jgi:phosphatidylglycerol:prolipoprotein diacylglycerol transferase
MFGGLLGGLVGGMAYALWRRLPLARLLDLAAIPLLAGYVVGRLGCLLSGDAYGRPTEAPWGIIYTSFHAMVPDQWVAQGVASHPVAAYEIAWSATLLVLVWTLRGPLRRPGTKFLLVLTGHALGRFVTTFWRGEELPEFWGLAQAQLVALIVLIPSLPLLALRLLSPHQEGLACPGPRGS